MEEEYDHERQIVELQNAYAESYSVLLAAKKTLELGQNDPQINDMITASEKQVEKIKAVLLKGLGEIGQSRIEEITGFVEASMASHFEEVDRRNSISSTSKKLIIDNPETPSTLSNITTTNKNNESTGMEISKIKVSVRDIVQLWRTMQPASNTTNIFNSRSNSPNSNIVASVGSTPEKAASTALKRLSQLAGIAREKLAHEISLDRNYQLPYSSDMSGKAVQFPLQPIKVEEGRDASGASSPIDKINVALSLRSKMLRLMGDKLINSLQIADWDGNPTSLKVDKIILVLFISNADIDILPDDCNIPILSARIMSIENEDFVNVEYLADGAKEMRVSTKRIRSSFSKPIAALLLQSLGDLCAHIASFTPNRSDIKESLFTSYDPELMKQMIENRALSPCSDLLPTLKYLLQSIEDLQAPSRVAELQHWSKSFVAGFYRFNGSDKQEKSFDEVLHLLPGFFEKATYFLEGIQHDMANYYISTVAPIMQGDEGFRYLSDSFIKGIEAGTVGLECTVQWLSRTIQDTDVNPAANSVTSIVAVAFVNLLQIPYRLDNPQVVMLHVPETLRWDVKRLSTARDIVDKVKFSFLFKTEPSSKLLFLFYNRSVWSHA